MDRQRLYQGVSKAAWAYLFLYFDINLGTVSILPDFIGRYLFVSAIELLSDEHRNLKLLKSFAIGLTVWDLIDWLLSFAGSQLDGFFPPLSLVVSLVNLYFHFQLLTDLSNLAAVHQDAGETFDGQLLKWRTVQTVMLSASLILHALMPLLGQWSAAISVITTLVYLVAAICLTTTLFRLRKSLQPEEPPLS